MKTSNLILGISALGLLSISNAAQADTILGVYAGGQFWQTDVNGGYGSAGSQQQPFDFDSEGQNSIYVALEHPMPLVPNVKIRRNDVTGQGQVNLSQNLSFNNGSYTAGQDLVGAVDLTHTDFTLYYEVFDNDLISLDLGLTAKRFDGSVAINNAAGVNQVNIDGFVPTGYGQLRVGIPATDWTMYALANAVSFEDSSVRDMEVGAEYRLLDNMAVNLNLQLGYRDLSIELDSVDSINTDLRFKGPYVGLEFHF